MAFSVPITSYSLVVLLFFLPLCFSNKPPTRNPGCLLANGTLNLAFLWYGEFEGTTLYEDVIGSFVKSLNNDGKEGLEPSVSSWWQVVESYQSATAKAAKSPHIKVKVVKSSKDISWGFGKVLSTDCIPKLAEKATGGKTDVVAVIFTSKEVTVHDLCGGTCERQGLTAGEQPYILVGNPIDQCPGSCAWPFLRQDFGPQGMTYQPPNGDVGVDSMTIQFAAALVDLITNPHLQAFSIQPKIKFIEAPATTCKGIFGTGAFPGYTGKIRVDPIHGGAFNTHGYNNTKYLIPAIWNPKTSKCWTPM